MIGAAQVRHLASATGFREEIVEKVLYLEAILNQLTRHPELRGAWALKGGTALNLFWLDVPRLSVDIDINYIGQPTLAGMQAARPGFEAAVVACCEREGCSVRRMPQDHAGGKLRLRYSSGIGGAGALELDLNFLLRVPFLAVEHRRLRFPPETRVSEVPLLALEEIAAGKFAALLARRAARDAFDGWQLLQMAPDLLDRSDFRLAFVVYAAGGREDLRQADPSAVTVSARRVEMELRPLLRVEGQPGVDSDDLAEAVNTTCIRATERLVAWSKGEREFLNQLNDHGRIVPDLLTEDPAKQALIRAQPLLEWKAFNVRKFKGLE